ncbi:hypothetical protein POM88_038435 [Heracleum sosnowskyi]|uniref:PDZ domain-containing protein n=1 Tax=Heracleum sosnowskyi TaxID=360622 RepID=A0AAD8H9A1_9APIA|nr:hypothetical protein POM88_038435 [Heracleum sosnowskyi]
MGRKEKGKMFSERSPTSSNYSLDDEYYFMNLAAKKPKFCERTFNAVQNIQEKRVALEVSPSILALVSYSGDEQVMEGSGTIIESNNDATIVLTAASFIRRCSVRNQFMENDLINDLKVTVYSHDGQSYKAKIGEVDDSLDVLLDNPSFELKHHSTSYKLSAGAEVYVVARYFYKPFDLMIASGAYWLDRCGYDCKELFKTSCRITKSGEGGPLINHLGEVIGIMYCDSTLTPCMLISIAYRWWEHFKTCGKYCRPLLGMEAGNFYTADVTMIERINQIFPSVYNGVIVEEVTEGSSASLAGLCVDDVIIECAGRRVNGFLVFSEIIWENVGDHVTLVVLRQNNIKQIHFAKKKH